MWRSRILVLAVVLAAWAFYSPTAHAGCVVETSATYEEGTSLRDDRCDTTGAKKVTTAGASGSSAVTATATENAPAYAEGQTTAPLSLNLSGGQRTTLETLLSGEDQGTSQATSLIRTGGAVVRGTVGNLASGLIAAADCTLHCTPAVVASIPVGAKTFTSTLVSSTSDATTVAQVHKIYGANISTFTSDDAVLLCTVTFTSATQYLLKAFTQSCIPVTVNFLYYGVISSGTTGTATVTGAVTATY